MLGFCTNDKLTLTLTRLQVYLSDTGAKDTACTKDRELGQQKLRENSTGSPSFHVHLRLQPWLHCHTDSFTTSLSISYSSPTPNFVSAPWLCRIEVSPAMIALPEPQPPPTPAHSFAVTASLPRHISSSLETGRKLIYNMTDRVLKAAADTRSPETGRCGPPHELNGGIGFCDCSRRCWRLVADTGVLAAGNAVSSECQSQPWSSESKSCSSNYDLIAV